MSRIEIARREWKKQVESSIVENYNKSSNQEKKVEDALKNILENGGTLNVKTK